MTLDDIPKSPSSRGHAAERHGGNAVGQGPSAGGDIPVVGIADAAPPSPGEAVRAAAPSRHDLLLVGSAGWPAVLATSGGRPELPHAAEALVRGWADAGWPVIARRPAVGDPPGAVPVGLPLPPAFGKARVALSIPAAVPWRLLPPVTLAEAAAAAPAEWRGTIDGLLDLARVLDLVPRVFGALLWRAATGMAYLGPGSDLDLLWPVRDAGPLGPLLDGLERVAARAPVSVDGEVLTAAGGVQWRELAAARRGETEVVLAKALGRAGFVRAAAILLRPGGGPMPLKNPTGAGATASRRFRGGRGAGSAARAPRGASTAWPAEPAQARAADGVAGLAHAALIQELETWPKPGLVSLVDSGSHRDMDAAALMRSADAIRPFFADLARAGDRCAGLPELRRIGTAAEAAMMAATGGVNAHRGAIFSLGLICAAEGVRSRAPGSAEDRAGAVGALWGDAILQGSAPATGNGAAAARRYGIGGARAEAGRGFPTVRDVGLPSLRAGRALAPGDPAAARVHCFFGLMAALDDTNLLHRGGAGALAFARGEAARFMAAGGVGAPGWRDAAVRLHAAFVERNLSPGGSADLLAATLFLDALEGAP